jgi:squalene-hopene/tetraprenyl-beta-curcumene cyclase
MRPRERTAGVAAGAIACLLLAGRAQAGDPAGWDARAAARHLDARASEWIGSATTQRGEGTDRVSCLSCHTSLPYLLARPSLRRAAGEDGPAAPAERLLADVRRRVKHWDDLGTPRFPFYYGDDDAKKAESRGTETVLSALVLATEDRRRGLKAPGVSTREALRHLWATQRTDGADEGSWDWLDFGLHPWEAGEVSPYFGATLAAIAVGTAPGDANSDGDPAARRGVERLRRYLRDRVGKQGLHNILWTLWASTTLDGILTPDERRRVVDQVFEAQQADGGWSLASLATCKRRDGTPQHPGPDGYATGLALHALRLAGVPGDDPRMARGLSWLRANQQPSGAWAGHSLNAKRDPRTHTGKFMSDAATAFAVLALTDP